MDEKLTEKSECKFCSRIFSNKTAQNTHHEDPLAKTIMAKTAAASTKTAAAPTNKAAVHPAVEKYTNQLDSFLQKYPTLTQYGTWKNDRSSKRSFIPSLSCVVECLCCSVRAESQCSMHCSHSNRSTVSNYLSYSEFNRTEKLKSYEKSTGYPAAWFFVLGTLLVVGVTVLIGGTKLLTNLTGFVYPAYMSFKSIEGSSTISSTEWLIYWIVFSLFTILETTVLVPVVYLIPFYPMLKLGVICWLWYPTTRGAQTVYEQLLRPNIKTYMNTSDGTAASPAPTNVDKKE